MTARFSFGFIGEFDYFFSFELGIDFRNDFNPCGAGIKSELLSEYTVDYIQEAMKNRGKSELETLAKAKSQHLD